MIRHISESVITPSLFLILNLVILRGYSLFLQIRELEKAEVSNSGKEIPGRFGERLYVDAQEAEYGMWMDNNARIYSPCKIAKSFRIAVLMGPISSVFSFVCGETGQTFGGKPTPHQSDIWQN